MTEGFSLIEVLVALFLSTIVFLMLAQTLGTSVEAGRAAADITLAATFAGDRLEELSQIDYPALAPGGSIGADIGGFSDFLDVDGDGTNEYRRRWEIADLGSSKRIRVRVISLLNVVGPPKEATYVTLIADK